MAIIINVNIKVLNIVSNIYKLQNRIKKLLFFTLHWKGLNIFANDSGAIFARKRKDTTFIDLFGYCEA